MITCQISRVDNERCASVSCKGAIVELCVLGVFYSIVFFFFKQKTAYEIKECDWSSDVCSSDLSEFTIKAHSDLLLPGTDLFLRHFNSSLLFSRHDTVSRVNKF